MNILKRIGSWLSILVLFIGLVGLAWSVVGYLTVRDKETVKGWLENAKVYENITDTILETAAKDAREENEDIDTNNPIIAKAVGDAFSPELIRENTEVVLDSVYAWLEGETDTLNFKLELGDAKTNFIDAAAGYAAERASDLPTCTSLPSQEFDPITAECLPAGYSTDDVEDEVKNQLTDNKDFLEKTSFAASDIKVGENEQQFVNSEEATRIKRGYQSAAYAPFVFGLITLFGLIGAVFLSPRKLFGVRRAGAIFVSSGLVLGISWVFLRIGQSISTTDISTPTDNNASENLIAGIIREVTQGIAEILIWFVIGYILIGIGLLVWTALKKRGQKPPENIDNNRGLEPKNEPAKNVSSTRTQKTPVKPRGGTPPTGRKIQL